MALGTRGLAGIFFLLCSTQAGVAAVSIQYSLVSLGGNSYEYIYSITNSSGSGPAVQLFDILFDTSVYSSLQILTPASLTVDWEEAILNPIPPAFPLSYTARARAVSIGIPAGSTLTGFTVQFTWTGTGTPGAQPFVIYDRSTLAVLQTGTTTQPQTIPATSTLSLALLGVALSAAALYQSRMRVMDANRSHSPESW